MSDDDDSPWIKDNEPIRLKSTSVTPSPVSPDYPFDKPPEQKEEKESFSPHSPDYNPLLQLHLQLFHLKEILKPCLPR